MIAGSARPRVGIERGRRVRHAECRFDSQARFKRLQIWYRGSESNGDAESGTLSVGSTVKRDLSVCRSGTEGLFMT